MSLNFPPKGGYLKSFFFPKGWQSRIFIRRKEKEQRPRKTLQLQPYSLRLHTTSTQKENHHASSISSKPKKNHNLKKTHHYEVGVRIAHTKLVLTGWLIWVLGAVTSANSHPDEFASNRFWDVDVLFWSPTSKAGVLDRLVSNVSTIAPVQLWHIYLELQW
jgi:hypothetical protein